MISYEAYKVVHLLAVLTLFAVLGGVAVHAANGGTRESNTTRRIVSGFHGAALLLALVTGFGLVSRLDLTSGGIPAWVWAKVGVWLVAGGLLVLPYRKPAWSRSILLLVLPMLAVTAAWLAVYKPGN